MPKTRSTAHILQQYRRRRAVAIAIRDSNACHGLGQDQCWTVRRILGVNTFHLVMAAARALWFLEPTHRATADLRCYRHEYLSERDMGRLTGRRMSLTPMDLEWDNHGSGLIRLRSIRFRGMTRLELAVCQHWAVEQTTRAGLDAGHPPRRPRVPLRTAYWRPVRT